MNLQLKFSKQAQNDLDFHKKSGNKAIQKKLISLLKEVSNSPFEGTGKPELLKYDLSGLWSRRINHAHRLIYEVHENSVLIHSLKGHYL